MDRTDCCAVAERWFDALDAFEVMTGTAPDADDRAMRTATDEDLAGWVDDLQARRGYETGEFSSAITAYCAARIGGAA